MVILVNALLLRRGALKVLGMKCRDVCCFQKVQKKMCVCVCVCVYPDRKEWRKMLTTQKARRRALFFCFHFSLNLKVFQSTKLGGKLYRDTIPHLLNGENSDNTRSG